MSSTPPGTERSHSQDAMERELVELFSAFAEVFGNPPSHGAIYGLLFAAQSSLTMEDITRRLDISKGSASQGLRHLEELGAVIRHREPGARTAGYTARLELKPLVAGFLNQRLLPGLTNGRQRLEHLRELLPDLPPDLRPGAKLRVQRIAKWHNRANALLPWINRILATK